MNECLQVISKARSTCQIPGVQNFSYLRTYENPDKLVFRCGRISVTDIFSIILQLTDLVPSHAFSNVYYIYAFMKPADAELAAGVIELIDMLFHQMQLYIDILSAYPFM